MALDRKKLPLPTSKSNKCAVSCPERWITLSFTDHLGLLTQMSALFAIAVKLGESCFSRIYFRIQIFHLTVFNCVIAQYDFSSKFLAWSTRERLFNAVEATNLKTPFIWNVRHSGGNERRLNRTFSTHSRANQVFLRYVVMHKPRGLRFRLPHTP